MVGGDAGPGITAAANTNALALDADYGGMVDQADCGRFQHNRTMGHGIDGWFDHMPGVGWLDEDRYRGLAINGWCHHGHTLCGRYDDVADNRARVAWDHNFAEALAAVGVAGALPLDAGWADGHGLVDTLDDGWVRYIADAGGFDEATAHDRRVGGGDVFAMDPLGRDYDAIGAILDDRRFVGDLGTGRGDDDGPFTRCIERGRAHFCIAFDRVRRAAVVTCHYRRHH